MALFSRHPQVGTALKTGRSGDGQGTCRPAGRRQQPGSCTPVTHLLESPRNTGLEPTGGRGVKVLQMVAKHQSVKFKLSC